MPSLTRPGPQVSSPGESPSGPARSSAVRRALREVALVLVLLLAYKVGRGGSGSGSVAAPPLLPVYGRRRHLHTGAPPQDFDPLGAACRRRAASASSGSSVGPEQAA